MINHDQTECVSQCNDNYYALDNKLCVDNCPAGQYGTDGKCVDCPPYQYRPDDAAPNELCKICDKGTYYFENSCIICKLQSLLVSTQGTHCVETCEPDYIDVNGEICVS